MLQFKNQNLGNVKLGKKPARYDHRTIKLKDYLVQPPLPAPPNEVSWVTKVPTPWNMYLNDQLGDCVIAAMAHMIMQWTFFSGKPYIPTDQQVLAAYEILGGYVPGDPSTDNGVVMLDALNYWRRTGFAGHQIVAFMAVDFTNLTEIRQAINLFGNVFTGIQLPLSVQTANDWTVPDGGPFGNGLPGSWGGHCIPFVASSPITHTCITWGQILKMSHNFAMDCVDEMYVVLSDDWLNANGLSPEGFNLTQLEADLGKLGIKIN